MSLEIIILFLYYNDSRVHFSRIIIYNIRSEFQTRFVTGEYRDALFFLYRKTKNTLTSCGFLHKKIYYYCYDQTRRHLNFGKWRK